MRETELVILGSEAGLRGRLWLPESMRGSIVCTEGARGSLFGTEGQALARALQGAGFGVLRVELLTPAEHVSTPLSTASLPMLIDRLLEITGWWILFTGHRWPIGYYGRAWGSAVVLGSAAILKHAISAVVVDEVDEGDTDFVTPELPDITASVCLIASDNDDQQVRLSRHASSFLRQGEWHSLPTTVGAQPRETMIVDYFSKVLSLEAMRSRSVLENNRDGRIG